MAFDSNLRMINWRGGGYFAYPEPSAEQVALSADRLAADPVLLWLTALNRAKRGDFGLMQSLVPICADDSNPILSTLSSELLGDAGPDSVIDSVAERLKRNADNYEVTLDFCSVLHSRGMLADVPILLDAFETIQTIEDAEIVPVYLSDCLEDEPGPLCDHHRFGSFGEYRRAVELRYQEIARNFGTDRILLLGGEPFGVLRLAQKMLTRLREPNFPIFLRRRFEASTGIDCSSFYLDRQFQPLRAAALIEAFLEDPGVSRYRDGERYFFGHPIPR
jgi:hypothetical protein